MPEVKAGAQKRITNKKIGVAMAGGGARAPMYFGVIDVLLENNIPIDMIAACSSATFIACCYASGTLDKLRKRAEDLSAKEIFNLFEPSMKGGLFSFGKVDDNLGKLITYDNIEELPIPVAIIASDLINGKNVVFRMGNIIRAIKASCSMPGLFEPIVWGDKVLVDGGLFSIVPTKEVREMGADIVIGIDLARSRHLYRENMLRVKRAYNLAKKPFVYLNQLRHRAFDYIFGEQEYEAKSINNLEMPSMLSVLGKAMDYAMIERKRAEFFDCDIMISPDNDKFKEVVFGSVEEMYQEGRRATLEVLPEIKRLMHEPVPAELNKQK